MKIRNWFFFLILALTVPACNPIFYSPNTQNVSLLTEKGETVAGVALSDNQLGIQANYAASECIGLQLSAGIFNPSDLDNGNGGSGNFIEGGIGYFKPLNSSIVFECYAIGGLGSFENHMPSTVETHPNTSGDISARLVRYGIQPNLGLKTRFFEAALSARLTHLLYSNIEGDLIFDGIGQVSYLEENHSNLVVEPAITLRAGIEKIKVQVQIGLSKNLTNPDFRQDEGFATVGIVGRFGGKSSE